MLQFPYTLDGLVYHSPPSFVLPSFASICEDILFSGQGLCPLSTGVLRELATEDVFLMHHPWREMYLHPPTPPTPYLWLCTVEFGFANILLKTFASKFIKP